MLRVVCAIAGCLLSLQEILRARGWEQDYPLFTTVNRIVNDIFPPSDIVNFHEVSAAALPAYLSACMQ